MAGLEFFKLDMEWLIEDMLSCLTEREREILNLRMKGLTFREIQQEKFNYLSYQRIQQIEKEAFFKLKKYCKSRFKCN